MEADQVEVEEVTEELKELKFLEVGEVEEVHVSAYAVLKRMARILGTSGEKLAAYFDLTLLNRTKFIPFLPVRKEFVPVPVALTLQNAEESSIASFLLLFSEEKEIVEAVLQKRNLHELLLRTPILLAFIPFDLLMKLLQSIKFRHIDVDAIEEIYGSPNFSQEEKETIFNKLKDSEPTILYDSLPEDEELFRKYFTKWFDAEMAEETDGYLISACKLFSRELPREKLLEAALKSTITKSVKIVTDELFLEAVPVGDTGMHLINMMLSNLPTTKEHCETLAKRLIYERKWNKDFIMSNRVLKHLEAIIPHSPLFRALIDEERADDSYSMSLLERLRTVLTSKRDEMLREEEKVRALKLLAEYPREEVIRAAVRETRLLELVPGIEKDLLSRLELLQKCNPHVAAAIARRANNLTEKQKLAIWAALDQTKTERESSLLRDEFAKKFGAVKEETKK